MQQKTKPNDQHIKEGEGGRKYQGNEEASGNKGHGLLNSDGFTAGLGSAVTSPSEAKKLDDRLEGKDESIDTDR